MASNSELLALCDGTTDEDMSVLVEVRDLRRVLGQADLQIGDLMEAANQVSSMGHLVGTTNWAFALMHHIRLLQKARRKPVNEG